MTVIYALLGVFAGYSVIAKLSGNWFWIFEFLATVFLELPVIIVMSILEAIFD